MSQRLISTVKDYQNAQVPFKAYLGYIFSGVETVLVPNYPASYYVRLPDYSFTTAFHMGQVQPIYGLPIEIKKNNYGYYEIVGIPADEMDAAIELYGTGVMVGSHETFMEDMPQIGTIAFTAGNILIGDGTVMNMEPLGNHAILHSMIAQAEGWLRKTGVGTYTAVKTNLSAAGVPTVNDDSGDGYAKGSYWIYLNDFWILTDSTLGAAQWMKLSGSDPLPMSEDDTGYYPSHTDLVTAFPGLESGELGILDDAGAGDIFYLVGRKGDHYIYWIGSEGLDEPTIDEPDEDEYTPDLTPTVEWTPS